MSNVYAKGGVTDFIAFAVDFDVTYWDALHLARAAFDACGFNQGRFFGKSAINVL